MELLEDDLQALRDARKSHGRCEIGGRF